MEIRSIGKEDLIPMAQVFAAVFSNPPWSEVWDEALAKVHLEEIMAMPNFYGWIAWEDGCLGAILGHVQHYSNHQSYYMDELFTHPSHLRKGIAHRLYDAMGEKMRQIGCGSVFLTTLKGSDAFHFYEKKGLRWSEESAVMYGFLSQNEIKV